MAYRDRIAHDLVRTALEPVGAVFIQGPRASREDDLGAAAGLTYPTEGTP